MTFDQALDAATTFLDPVLDGQAERHRWSRDTRAWL